MHVEFKRSPIALAVIASIGAGALTMAPKAASAATPGKYVAGDFHNHTTCSDGTISMQKLVNKSTAVWGLDWFVQAGHGGNGNRNCTLTEDADLNTPAYTNPSATVVSPAGTSNTSGGPYTNWASSIGSSALKGDGASGSGNMWRWQSIKEYQYPLMEYLSALKQVPLFMGLESVVAGHEHTSLSVVTGQMPASIDGKSLTPPYSPDGNATALAQWSYCFDRGDTDTSRGAENQWDCSNPDSADSTSATLGWSSTAKKLIQPGGAGTGTKGHLKTVEAVKWMAKFHGNASYYVPAHLERAGPFNPDGNNGFNVEHLRNFNNASPDVAFGFETQPGHGASNARGEYALLRNSFGAGNFVLADGTTKVNVDSVGGTTYGGTGVYGAQIGGVWDALLGEGRSFWFFASSDWHNRGIFSADDRRSTQDFQPGEYQRNYTMVRNGADKLRPQSIVDGLRTGNTFAASGQLVDRLAFVACVSYPGFAARTNAQVEALAVAAATNNTDVSASGCATMGQKLVVRAGGDVIIAVATRDPAGANNAPYSFANPSLAQIGVSQPLNQPVLDHIDVIRGLVSGYRTPGAPDYSGEWPRNTNWLGDGSNNNPALALGQTAGLAAVPAAAKNTSAAVIKTFAGGQSPNWTPVNSPVDATQFLKMSLRIPAVQASQYVRLRGTNLPAAVPFETDASGNPLADVFTNADKPANLRIPCAVAGTNVPSNYPNGYNPKADNNASVWTQDKGTIDGCPAHLASVTNQAGVPGYPNGYTGKMVSYDVAAWADLWFYSNPIYVEVTGSTLVAGVK